jgi:hypothetical protein
MPCLDAAGYGRHELAENSTHRNHAAVPELASQHTCLIPR